GTRATLLKWAHRCCTSPHEERSAAEAAKNLSRLSRRIRKTLARRAGVVRAEADVRDVREQSSWRRTDCGLVQRHIRRTGDARRRRSRTFLRPAVRWTERLARHTRRPRSRLGNGSNAFEPGLRPLGRAAESAPLRIIGL